MAAGKCVRKGKRYGFGRDARITKKREYLDIYGRGQRYERDWMKLFVLAREGERVRIGLTVSRRVGSGVTRNRVKRLLREAIRRNRERVGFGADIVVVAKPGIETLSYHQVEAAVVEHLEEIARRPAPQTSTPIGKNADQP